VIVRCIDNTLQRDHGWSSAANTKSAPNATDCYILSGFEKRHLARRGLRFVRALFGRPSRGDETGGYCGNP